MVEDNIDFDDLAKPFPPEDVEWRISRAGYKRGTQEVWATVLAYITNRAVQQRFDDVCRPNRWRNEYIETKTGWFLCGISIKVFDEWITKWDGAEQTKVEEVKGGLSASMKRAAVQWGPGRYLYGLTENFATIADNSDRKAMSGSFKDKANNGKTVYFKWYPPSMPAWALPAGFAETKNPASKTAKVSKAPDIAKAEMEINAAVDMTTLQAIFEHWYRESTHQGFREQITTAKDKRKLALQDSFIADYDEGQEDDKPPFIPVCG